MKKTIIFFILFLIIASSVSAASGEYYDYNTGYGGIAVAVLDEKGIEFSHSKEIKPKMLPDMLPIFQEARGALDYFCEPYRNKLTKEEKWLIKQALNQYDYYNGEKYYVAIQPKIQPNHMLYTIELFIEITDSKREEYQIIDSFYWGFYY